MKFLEHEIKLAKQAIKEVGHVYPTIKVYGSKSNAMLVFADFPSDHQEKVRAMIEAGAKMGQEKDRFGDLDEVYFVCEAYMAKKKHDSPKSNLRVSQRKDKVEIVIISSTNAKKETGLEILRLVRDNQGKAVTLKKEIKKETPTEINSPLTDAFLWAYLKAQGKAVVTH